MKYGRLEQAIFLTRLNRFTAEVCPAKEEKAGSAVKLNKMQAKSVAAGGALAEAVSGERMQVHVKNTGRLRELLKPGAVCWLKRASNPNRKTPCDLIAVEHEGEMVSIDSQMPNDLVEEWLPVSGLFSEHLRIRREVKHGESRFDFYLEDGDRRVFLEVKGVTLRKHGEAFFPDAPTERGVKHIEELIHCREEGLEAMLVFVVQRKGVSCVRPNDETQPEFGEALRRAEQAGVKLLACDCLVSSEEIRIDRRIPMRTGKNTEEVEAEIMPAEAENAETKPGDVEADRTGSADVENQGCHLCPRNCGAFRSEGKKGYCGVDATIRVSRAALHMWEEPCISGTQGSGAVFFSGCPMHCVYCQNYEIAGGRGKEITLNRLAEIFLELQEKGAANINLVTPTHYSLQIAEAVRMTRRKGLHLPIVYNCSGYESVDTLRSLKEIVDIYLTDFKYPDTEGAERYSHAPDYPERAMEALEEMVRQQSEPVFDENGMMQRGVIVRHLLLPGRVKQAKETVRRIYEKFGNHLFFSLMNQYTPFPRIGEKYPELARRVTDREYNRLLDYVLDLGVENAFIQEGETAKESFIPAFDGEGV